MASNAFQAPGATGEDRERALSEFEGVVQVLVEGGIEVLVEQDTEMPSKPDAVFPNNWFSSHHNQIVLYPMATQSRAAERRQDLILKWSERFEISEVLDFSSSESDGRALEGTGSLVLDRVHRVAYVCVSQRSQPDLVKKWAEDMEYEFHMFRAVDGNRKAIYHTNVMMSIGTDWGILCESSVRDEEQLRRLFQSISDSGRRVISISLDQMAAFCGNILELKGSSGQKILMSQSAFAAFSPSQRRALGEFGDLLVASIPTIERFGGGSVRCMVAENFWRDSVSLGAAV